MELISGNEAIARGAWEAGVTIGVAYPGTPSTETMETFAKQPGVYAEWCPNEKVAVEVGLGACAAGRRVLSSMKHVGVNVAADPLFTAAYVGLPGGFVLVSADDPLCHSSQDEQDNRTYARFMGMPCFEPATAQEAKDMTREALLLARELQQPVMLRTTTRVNHLRGPVTFGALGEPAPIVPFERNPMRFVPVPAVAQGRHKVLVEHLENARAKAEAGRLLFGTVETWLIWKLTCGRVHVTDYTNASRTMLFNIHTLEWDEEILRELNIPRQMLPTPMPSSCFYAEADPMHFGAGIKIAGAAGDQQAALFGQTCFSAGEAKNTFGTGGFLLMNTGKTPVISQNGLVTTIACSSNGSVNYALEGSIFVAGAAIQWLRDELRLLEDARDSEYMAQKVKDTNGCYVVPAFTGLGAPHWDQYARGTIVGLTRGCNKNHIIRATLDSLCYQVNDVLHAMEADSGIAMKALKVDGGACANNYLMQTMADISNLPVERPCCVETTALGAAYLAGLAVGYWSSTDEVVKNWSVDRTFLPQITAEERAKRIKGWNKAVRCSYHWALDEEES